MEDTGGVLSSSRAMHTAHFLLGSTSRRFWYELLYVPARSAGKQAYYPGTWVSLQVKAAHVKERLENEQRKRRKKREESGGEYTSPWFTRARCDISGQDYWKFNGKYWQQRDKFGSGEQ